MMREAFLFRHARFALSMNREMYFPRGRLQFMREMRQWSKEAYGIGHRSWMKGSGAMLILLSYKRPWNIEPLVRMGLRLGCIEHILVSNNNPAIDMRHCVRIQDERLTILAQPQRCTASIMPLLAARAARQGFSRFLAVDDDVFLLPEQIERVLACLEDQLAIPHGIVGQMFTDTLSGRSDHVTGEREVDVLNRAYAFTDKHALAYERLLSALGRTTPESQAALPFGSDIVLSATGDGRPHIHDVGPFLSCPTAALPGIALFREEGFDAFRAALFQSVTATPHSAA
jgi:hypothetical protein